MQDFEPLVVQYRGELIEGIHYGAAVWVDSEGRIRAIGNPDRMTFFRSSSKPIQALPVLIRGLDRKYGLTDAEIAVMSGSHWAEEIHVGALEGILAKTGLKEEDMIMLPTYPRNPGRHDALLRAGKPPRKIYHNCSGKHLAMMLLQRDLGKPVRDYWEIGSAADKTIRELVSVFSGTPVEQIGIGVDGCGVPVYAVPLRGIARSFVRLVRPELLPEGTIREAAARNLSCLTEYPVMLDGAGQTCATFFAEGDLLSKAGAQALYPVGIRSEASAVAVRIVDGNNARASFAALHMIRQMGVSISPEQSQRLDEVHPSRFSNDNGKVVGRVECVFNLSDLRDV